MLRKPAIAILVAGISATAWGQPAPAPQFEVASIKPAPPQPPGRVSTRLSTDAGRLNYTNVSLTDLLGQAYAIQHNQISGPDWLDSERFDIVAKIPEGATTDQLPRMFQALLADRFKLQTHTERKDLPIYTLVVGKGGAKLQKAETTSGLGSGGGQGYAHVSGRVTMARLADYLSQRLGRPVRDQTALEGAYGISLDWVPDLTQDAGSASGPSLFTALQEQLGLKLVGSKGPVEMLVIDHVEKAPTEN